MCFVLTCYFFPLQIISLCSWSGMGIIKKTNDLQETVSILIQNTSKLTRKKNSFTSKKVKAHSRNLIRVGSTPTHVVNINPVLLTLLSITIDIFHTAHQHLTLDLISSGDSPFVLRLYSSLASSPRWGSQGLFTILQISYLGQPHAFTVQRTVSSWYKEAIHRRQSRS